jgi:hypothetical protein
LGIENAAQTVGIQYYFDGTYHELAVPVTDSFAIRYATFAPTPGIEEYGNLDNIPSQTRLAVVQPNPFTQRTSVSFQLAKRARINLNVYDVAGRLVSQLADGFLDPGYYSVNWDGHDHKGRRVPAGIYFIRMDADGQQQVQKMVLLK